METANSDTFRTPSSHKNININIYLFIYMMFYVDISLNVCVRTFPCTSIIVEAITIIMDPTHKSTSTNLHLLLPVNVPRIIMSCVPCRCRLAHSRPPTLCANRHSSLWWRWRLQKPCDVLRQIMHGTDIKYNELSRDLKVWKVKLKAWK